MGLRDSIYTDPSALRAKYFNPRNVLGGLDEASSEFGNAQIESGDNGGGTASGGGGGAFSNGGNEQISRILSKEEPRLPGDPVERDDVENQV